MSRDDRPDADPFTSLDQSLRDGGPDAALDRLVGMMEERDDPRGLLDALLLKARHQLGMPSVAPASLNDVPEPQRTQYEDRYVESIRTVGNRLLARGDLLGAWPFFRAIGEKEPIAEALERFEPSQSDESVGHIVEVAFNGAAHPRRGFELILDHYGVCSAITAFESLPAEEAVRVACAERLIRRLHEHLVMSLRSEIERRGQPMPPEGTPVSALLEGRGWLFADDAYHLDVSHLAAVVRLAPMVSDPEILKLAVELTDYGASLSERHRYEGEPPFERLYEDHGRYLRALLGQDADGAIRYFRDKLPPPDSDSDAGETFPAQSLVRLLVRLGRLDEAIDVSSEYLRHVPEGMLIVPGLTQLCGRAGRLDRLAGFAKEADDPVRYAAAILPSR